MVMFEDGARWSSLPNIPQNTKQYSGTESDCNMSELTDTVIADDMMVTMRRMIDGLCISRNLYVAAELGLADLLKHGPVAVEVLARATASHEPSLYRVMRSLVSVGIFVEDDQKRFGLTPLAATLRSDVPESMRDFVVNSLGKEAYRAWGHIMHTVQTGETAFDHAFGMGVWQYRAEHPDHGAVFDQSRSSVTEIWNAAVTARYAFSNFKKVIDIGGGDGSLMISILRANPLVKGIVVDLPRVAERANARIVDAGLADRCKFISSDAFESLPNDGDAYILSRVIHNWNDQRSVALLKSCYYAMTPDAKLLLIERYLPERVDQSTASRTAVLSDMGMLVMTGGCERTESEYHTLLARAGLSFTKVIVADSGLRVIEAVRER